MNISPLRLRRCAAAVTMALAALGPTGGFAQTANDRVSELERKLERSQRMIEELANRLKQLEAAAPKKEEVVTQSARIDSVEQQVSQIASANASRRSDDTGLAMHGFADVGLGTTTNKGARKGFTINSLDFYLNPQLGERTKALIELNTEVDSEGGVGVDLERLQIGYTFSDAATAWMGRFHTPYGYYNTAFHHGQQIATSLRRPKFIDFEDKGGILPAHTVGAWLTGNVRAGQGKITYDAYTGNSPRIAGSTLDMNNGGSQSHNRTTGGNLGYQFGGGLDGLKVGAHYLQTRVDDDQDVVNSTKVGVWGGYLVYDTDNWEHIAEIYRFNNSDVSGRTGTRKSNAGFVQMGYRAGLWTPYGRYERATLDQNDNYFAQQASGGSYTRQALGLRFDLDLKSALKLELARTRLTDRNIDAYSEALVQYSIRF
jgi:hypothetical protein